MPEVDSGGFELLQRVLTEVVDGREEAVIRQFLADIIQLDAKLRDSTLSPQELGTKFVSLGLELS